MATAEEDDVDLLAAASPFLVKIMLALVIICDRWSEEPGELDHGVGGCYASWGKFYVDSEKLGGKDEDERSWRVVL